MDYMELDNEGKIAAIGECRFTCAESLWAQEYINALALNATAEIEEFESFGDSPRHIIENRMRFERGASVYGFIEKCFNEYGWLMNWQFADCESVYFGLGKQGIMGRNSITIGRGPNNNWTYGISCSASKAGYGCCMNVFREPCATRHECLRVALVEMIEWHTKENDQKTAPLIKEAQGMLDEITGRKPKQLSLFGM